MFREFTALILLLAATAAPEAPPSGTPDGGGTGTAALSGRGAPLTPAAPPSVRPLPFFYDLYSFRGPPGSTTVIASFAVAAGRLEEEDEDHEVRYRFAVRLVLADTALRTISRTDDSVFVAASRELPGDHLLHTHIEVQAPPSRATVQRVIMTDASTPGIGQLYHSRFPIPDYSGPELMLSDIALGLPDAEAGWTRNGVTLALLPTSQFPGGSFDLYYEIYNLPVAHEYSTEVVIEGVPDEDGAATDPAVRTRFTDRSGAGNDDTVRELRRVDASLPRGRYRISVTVTDLATGQKVVRSRPLRVRGWRDGATMVPACPAARLPNRHECETAEGA